MNKIALPQKKTDEPVDPYGRNEHRLMSTPTLLQLWRTVWSYKWMISIIVVACVIAGLIITLLTTPRFSANSRIEISREQAKDSVTNVQSLQEEDIGQSLEFYQTQYSLLEARSLASRVARSLNLQRDDNFFEAFRVDPDAEGFFGSSSPANPSSSEGDERLKLAVEILLENIDIRPIRGSSLVDIRFTSPSPRLSARIANAWTDQYIAANLDRRFASTADARKFLEERLAQLRERLEESERRLVGYASRNRIISLGAAEDAEGKTRSSRTLVASDLESMNNALAAATASRISAASSVNSGGSISRTSLENSAINGLRQERASVASEYARLLTQFEPEYPTVKALESKIAALDRSIDVEEARVKSAARSSYSIAVAREQDLKKRVEELKDSLNSQRRDSIQYNIYQRDVDTNRQLYDGLLQRYKEIGVAGVGNNNVAIVDRAEVPDKPSSPNLPRNLLLSIFLGFGLAGTVIFALEQVDQSLKDPQELQSTLGISLLGGIPNIENVDLLTQLADRKSSLSEAYLSVKTNLSFLTDHGVPRSLMLTSTSPNEGKSMSSVALAKVIARSGKSVVLVDADMRNPSVIGMLQLKAEQGLTNYLSGMDQWEELLVDTDIPNLSVLGAGPTPPNAAELLGGERFGALVQALCQKFDHVVVDSPPILGLADAPLLSCTVEGVVFTIEANRVKISEIEAAINRLRAANATLLGGIVNKLDNKASSYGYGYGYHYGYGNDEDES